MFEFNEILVLRAFSEDSVFKDNVIQITFEIQITENDKHAMCFQEIK